MLYKQRLFYINCRAVTTANFWNVTEQAVITDRDLIVMWSRFSKACSSVQRAAACSSVQQRAAACSVQRATACSVQRAAVCSVQRAACSSVQRAACSSVQRAACSSVQCAACSVQYRATPTVHQPLARTQVCTCEHMQTRTAHVEAVITARDLIVIWLAIKNK